MAGGGGGGGGGACGDVPASATKTKISSAQAALGLVRLTHQLTESSKSAKAGDFSPLEAFGRGLNDLSAGLIAGNRGLSVALEKGVLLSYELGGFSSKARVGAHMDLEVPKGFTVDQARKVLNESVREVQGGGLFALLRGSMPTKVTESRPGVLVIQMMDACDDGRGTSYVISPDKLARKATLAASVRDAFLEKAKAQGAKVLEVPLFPFL